jgi:hypothetical protein
MKKLIFLCLLLVCMGCTHYNATVRIVKCSGEIDTVNMNYTGNLHISTYKQAVPILSDACECHKILNVCEFQILKQEEI